MSGIGIIGAHRTGKTTLARAFAERFGIEFVQTSTSEVIKSLGFDINESMSLADRLYVQNQVLCDAEEKYKAASEEFITDRTPMDMAAYMLGEITQARAAMLEEDRELDAAIEEYLVNCYKVTNRHFGSVFLLQPGIPYKEDENDKVTAAFSKAYIAQTDLLMKGLISDTRLMFKPYVFASSCTDIEERITAVVNTLDRDSNVFYEAEEGESLTLH